MLDGDDVCLGGGGNRRGAADIDHIGCIGSDFRRARHVRSPENDSGIFRGGFHSQMNADARMESDSADCRLAFDRILHFHVSDSQF